MSFLYRYLKLNYEKEGDLKQAGDFHYGEMEMHRKSNFWRRLLLLTQAALFLLALRNRLGRRR